MDAGPDAGVEKRVSLVAIAALVLVLASIAGGVALRNWGSGTSVTSELLTERVAGRTEVVERTTVTETRTVEWWLLIPIGGATAATGLLVVDSARRSRAEPTSAR